MSDDQEQLRLICIFHYVVAGFSALMGCLPIIHLTVGIGILTGFFDQPQRNAGPDQFIGWIFVGLACVSMAMAWSGTVVILLSARFLQRRTHHTFCLVVAGLECLMIPFGTILGVFTIVVLTRPSVERLFDESRRGENLELAD